MILTTEVTYIANKGNKGSLKKLLNINIISGEIYKIPIDILSNKSNKSIKVICDKCGKELEIPYKYYTSYTKNNTIDYLCIKCCKIRYKETCLKKYGFENPHQNINVIEKTKETCLKRYDVDNPSKNIKIINKIKETFNKKYDVDNCFQNSEIKNKILETNLIKYGGHPSKTDEVIQKMQKTCFEKFGYISYAQTDLFKISQGIILDKDIKNEFQLYKRKSRRLFDKIKNNVFENWDGYDFYDGEFIKDYLNLSFKDKKYPTIDHKISIYFGFMNNISVEDINKIENLVVTKRCINSSKGK